MRNKKQIYLPAGIKKIRRADFFDFFQFSIDNCITGAIIKTNI